MLIYNCVFCNDEMCSDSYPMKMLHDGVIMEVDAATIKEGGGIDDALIGGNASAEGEDADAGADDGAVMGINVIMNARLATTQFTKKDFQTFMKGFMKKVLAHLEKENPDRVAPFKKGAQAAFKEILGSFKDWEFYTGENMDPDGSLALLNYREDGVSPYFWFFKDGLNEEKF